MNWLLLIISLPTENSTARMRAWRAVKASGAAVLRDGVYLLPEREACRVVFDNVAADVRSGGGTAYVMRAENRDGDAFSGLFERSADYAALLADAALVRGRLSTADNAPELLKQIRKLRKTFTVLAGIDFFPGEPQQQTDATLLALELTANRLLAPGEPYPVETAIVRLAISDYQGKLWATRQRPWVDRLASAWLIRRYIDAQARFLWLASPIDCPPDALGFDFDGACFSHVGPLVTFEVLLASFGLEQPALKRMGNLVHYLDAGGIPPSEAGGVECVLAGLCAVIADDDQLLTTAGCLFDGLLASFEKGVLP
ncbi:MAG: chromate resistance protein [Methylovulum sp.]|nr:chromate resistance protein [Methylovulum sp.]